MKKNYLLLAVASFSLLSAQVGINTANPQGVFHVDSQKNNDAGGTGTDADDVVINNSGYLGVGVVNPQLPIQVNTKSLGAAIRIKNTQRPLADDGLTQFIDFFDMNDQRYGYIGDGSRFKAFGIGSYNNYITALSNHKLDTGGTIIINDARVETSGSNDFNRISLRVANNDAAGNTVTASLIRVDSNGRMGLDVATTLAEKLEVNGKVKAQAFIAGTQQLNVPDYVFEKYYLGKSTIYPKYQFLKLTEVEKFIKKNGHLPGYKSATQIKEDQNVDITAHMLINMEKIEELYLHLIEKDKVIKELKEENSDLKKDISLLKSEFEELKSVLKKNKSN